MRRRTLKVELAGYSSLVAGHGAHELLRALGQRPVWISRRRGFSCSEQTARDVVAAAETRFYDIEITGRRSVRDRAREALLAAPPPRDPRVGTDPGAGLW